MINDKKQNQHVSNNSKAYQANRDININGLGYEDVRNIALTVFEANFLELSRDAADLAYGRATRFIEDYLKEIAKNEEIDKKQFKEPDLQNSIFEAQKEFAKSGDEELREILIDLLVKRTLEDKRTVRQISLNEAILTVPKITNTQINILTLNFSLTQIGFRVNSFNQFKGYAEKCLLPFIYETTERKINYKHLEYCRCLVKRNGYSETVGAILRRSFPNLLKKSFTIEKFESNVFSALKYPSVIFPSLYNKGEYQLNVGDRESLNILKIRIGISETDLEKLWNFHQSNQKMTGTEIEKHLEELDPKFKQFTNNWNNLNTRNLELTSVGLVIAEGNFRKIVGTKTDLGKWINC